MAEVGTQTDSSPSFIAVRDEEMKCEPVELPLDKDDSLAIATLQLEFPSAAGLKYKNPQTGLMRILKAENDRVLPPLEGWGSGPYIVCVTKVAIKRPAADSSVDNGPPAKVNAVNNNNFNKPVTTAASSTIAKPITTPQQQPAPAQTAANNSLNNNVGSVPVYTNTPISSANTSGKPANTMGDRTQSSCNICNVTMNSLSQMQHHYEGKRHKDMVLMAQRGRGGGIANRGVGPVTRPPIMRGLPMNRPIRPPGGALMPTRPMNRGGPPVNRGGGRPLMPMRGGRGVVQMAPPMRQAFRANPPMNSFANDDWLSSGFNDFSGPQPW